MGNNQKLKKAPNLKTQVKFLKRFTQLVENGFPIIDALDIMGAMMNKEMMAFMKAGCERGTAFSDILEQLKFKRQIVYMIRASEKHYILTRGLKRAANYSENYLKNQTEMSKKIRYPLFLFTTVIVGLTAVSIFFLPRLDAFYATFNIEGNSFAIDTIIFLLAALFVGVLVSVLLLNLAFKWKNHWFQQTFRKIIFNVPLLKGGVKRLFTYYFFSQIELFLGCGLSFKESLESVGDFETLPLVKIVALELMNGASEGRDLFTLLTEQDCFSPYFKLMSGYALRIGKLEDELKNFVATELESLNQLMSQSLKVMQSSLLALVGLLVALLYLSILQPVFDLIHII